MRMREMRSACVVSGTRRRTHLSFSIISEARCLDLVATTVEDLDAWKSVLTAVLLRK
jgi:hypothetical protein